MSHICEKLLNAAHYLEVQGMSVQQLRALHHSQSRLETFASTYKYFGTNRMLRLKNERYAERLIFVAEEWRKGNGNFVSLVQRALERWPL